MGQRLRCAGAQKPCYTKGTTAQSTVRVRLRSWQGVDRFGRAKQERSTPTFFIDITSSSRIYPLVATDRAARPTTDVWFSSFHAHLGSSCIWLTRPWPLSTKVADMRLERGGCWIENRQRLLGCVHPIAVDEGEQRA